VTVACLAGGAAGGKLNAARRGSQPGLQLDLQLPDSLHPVCGRKTGGVCCGFANTQKNHRAA
jgi:hypothetical protein